MQECCRSDQQSGECSDSGSLAIVAPAASYANGFSQPRKKPRASDAFASDCACSGVNEKNRDEDLTKNATQCSIDLQIFPLIPERILSELPKPPLSDSPIAAARCDLPPPGGPNSNKLAPLSSHPSPAHSAE